MRIPVVQTLIATALFSLLLGPLSTAVQAADAFKMGVVDPQMVLEKSKAGKKALDGLKEYVTTRQKLLSRDEEELRNYENSSLQVAVGRS